MFLRELNAPVTSLKGAGPAAALSLSRLGIRTMGTLLCHYPRDWEDRSAPVPLKSWNKASVCTEVKILAKDWFGFGRKKTLKIYVEDESARACLVCFNRSFMDKKFQVGMSCRLFGQFSYRFGELQSTTFEIESLSAGITSEPILPVYPLCAGLTQTILRKFMRQALQRYSLFRETPSGIKTGSGFIEDELPSKIIKRDGLFHKAEALRAIHFPSSQEELARAKKTLVYEELFYLEIMVGRRAIQRKNYAKNFPQKNFVPSQGDISPGDLSQGDLSPGDLSPTQRRLLERLAFSLTPGQEAAIAEINKDMDGPFPMARLLQGDVGSGKTLVSFLAAIKAVEKGGQAALMAPTELLARQHADNAALLLEPLGLRIAFLTGNLKAAGEKGRAQLLKALLSGEVDFVVGTHALFSRDVLYKDLRLVVVDEQHRFGVLQRQAIMEKSSQGHLLMMSATPIPRSLALTVFGDLDVSVIKDMPPGRKNVITHLAKESNEDKVYDFVRGLLKAGQQAYFVYPLIEGGDENDLKDAVSMAERLAKEVFPGYPLELLHSRVAEDSKRRIMEAFRRGEIKILAATSVVEVGVDVSNATCMVVEHAERFGLSALHQLRGRVGRGREQSYCFLVYSDELSDDGKVRLKAMLESNDGFVIAEEDLKLRGPGQIAGVQQSGFLNLGIADPVRDAAELARARLDAFAILEADPALEKEDNRRIAEVLERAPPFSDTGSIPSSSNLHS